MYSFTPKQLTILVAALETFGYDRQVDKAIEEMSELTKALLKYREQNSDENLKNIIDEIADVKITMEQMQFIYDGLCDKKDLDCNVFKRIDYKMDRLFTRIIEARSQPENG